MVTMRPAQDGELRGTATAVIEEKEKNDMRIGAIIFNQNYHDWDRYEAEEQGRAVPKCTVRSDREIFTEELNIARIADNCGSDEIMFIFKYGSMPMAAAEKSLRLFAKEVMPALKELNPAPLTV
jgi:hypothetical protein